MTPPDRRATSSGGVTRKRTAGGIATGDQRATVRMTATVMRTETARAPATHRHVTPVWGETRFGSAERGGNVARVDETVGATCSPLLSVARLPDGSRPASSKTVGPPGTTRTGARKRYPRLGMVRM